MIQFVVEAVVEGWVVDFIVHDAHVHAVVMVVVIGLGVGPNEASLIIRSLM